MKTTKQFPVNPGTVVEVTCSDADVVNKGSSVITCVTETVFTYSDLEPDCKIPGLSFATRLLFENFMISKLLTLVL